MPDAPRFSVTIPAYNAASTLAETVASVTAQTFADWELVIVDDGSTDGTRALAQRLAADEPRICVVSQENRGSGGAYNTAVRNARADLLVMLSADDLLLPEHLAAMDAFIAENPDASIFTGDGYFEYEDGSRARQNLNDRWRDAGRCELSDLLHACWYGIGAVYRRAVYDAVGGFREDIYAEDYIFWLFALAHGYQHRLLDQPLSVHRRNAQQKSADALTVRQADVRAVREVVESGLLGERDLGVANAVLRELSRNIVLRRVLDALLGPIAATRLLNRIGTLRRRGVR